MSGHGQRAERGVPVSYNGWSNYKTWNVALWIDSDPGSYEEARDMAKRAGDAGHFVFVSQLKKWVHKRAPDLGYSMFSDLLNSALGEVDWHEMAEHWHDDVHEDDGRG